MGNLLESLDKLVVGLLDYFYSILKSWWLLLRHPVTAPLALARNLRNRRLVQISGLMCLVLSYGVILATVLPLLTQVAGSFGGRSDTIPSLSTDNLLPGKDGSFRFETGLPFLVGGFVAAVVIDAVNRLCMLALRLPGPVQRRLRPVWQFAAAAGPVALAAILLTLAAALVLLEPPPGVSESGVIDWLVENDLAYWAIFGLAVVFIARGFRGIAIAVQHGYRGSAASARALIGIGAAAIQCGAFLAAMSVALVVAEAVGTAMYKTETPRRSYDRCEIIGDEAVATIAYVTDSSQPQEFDVNNTRISFWIDSRGFPDQDKYRRYFSPSPGEAPIVVKGAPTVLTSRVPVPEPLRGRKNLGCSVG